MDAETNRWAWGIATVVILGLIGVVYASFLRRQDKASVTVDDHQGRLAVIETTIDGHDQRIGKLEREVYDEPRGIIARLHAHGREIQSVISDIANWMRGKK